MTSAQQLLAANPPTPTVIRFEIPGEPHAQARQRHRIVRLPGREYVQNYQPAESRNWKAAAQEHARRALLEHGARPFTGPVRLRITAYFTCPRSDWRKTTPRAERWHTKKPDADNVLKATMDSFAGVLWIDDTQACDVRIRKRIAAQGEAPRIVVEIEEITEGRAAPQPRRMG